MSILIGFMVGIISMAVVMGLCATIGTLVFNHVDATAGLYAGIAAGVIIVLAAVAWLA